MGGRNVRKGRAGNQINRRNPVKVAKTCDAASRFAEIRERELKARIRESKSKRRRRTDMWKKTRRTFKSAYTTVSAKKRAKEKEREREMRETREKESGREKEEGGRRAAGSCWARAASDLLRRDHRTPGVATALPA